MKYFKNELGEVYAYDSEQLAQAEVATDGIFKEIADKIAGMTELTGAELEEYLNPTPTTEQLAAAVRAKRDRFIESVRWRIERHNDELALGSEPTEPLEPLLQYAQALRDVPQQAGFPIEIVWPEEV